MEFVYFTIAGIVLYFVSDLILTKIESMYGKPLPNRTIVFFFIILVLALVTFNLIQYVARM